MSVSSNPTSEGATTVILRQSSQKANNCGIGIATTATSTCPGRPTTATPACPGSAGNESRVNRTMWPDLGASSNPCPVQDSAATSKSSCPCGTPPAPSSCATSTATTATPACPGSAGNESRVNRTMWPDLAASSSPCPVQDSAATSKSSCPCGTPPAP